MSSRGRQPRGAGNNSPLSRSARLGGGTAGTATRSTSGSPSSRTRSLAPSLKKSTLTKKMINKKSNSNPAGSGNGPAAAAPISAKRRSSAEERARFRKGRRPKFQDNPPAPEIVEKKEALQLLEETSRIAQQDEEELTEEMEDSEEEEEVDDDEDAAVQAASNLTTPTNGVHHHPSATVEEGETAFTNTENGFKRKLESEFDEGSQDGIDGKRAKIEEAHSETEIKTEELLMNGDNNSDEIVIGESGLSTINSVTLCKQLKEAVKDLNNSESLKSELISKLKSILTEHTEVKLDNPSAVFSGMLENQLSMQSDDKAAMVEELVSTYLEHQQIERRSNEDHEDNHDLIVEDNTTTDDDNEEIEVPSSELKSEIDSEESESMPSTDLLMPQVDGVDSSEKDEQESTTTKEDCNNDHKTELNNDNNITEECDLNKTVNNHNNISPNKLSSSNVAADNKSKILSEMENKFAKETQNALKNRPTYRKKSKSETWELTAVHNGSAPSSKSPNDHHSKSMLIKEPGELEVAEMIDEMDEDEETLEDKNDENTPMPMISPSSSSASTTKSLRKFRRGNTKYDDHDQDQGPPVITKGTTNPPNTPPKSSRNTMSPPPQLTPEMPTPLRIDIPDHYTPSPISSSSFSGGYNRRLVIRTPPAARAGLVTMVSEAVLSKEDAEVAATAVTLSSPKPASGSHEDQHPSLKIRLPKVGPIPPIPQVIVPSSSVTPHHKKVPKRRNLHTAAVESDGLDTEEDEELKVKATVKKKPWLDQDDLTKTDEEMEGGKTTPDSQITSDDRYYFLFYFTFHLKL